MSFRVATYNIRKCVGLDWRRRPDRILAVLAEIGADVVALQEADRRFGERESTLPLDALAEAGWTPARVARRDLSLGWHGNAILLGPRAQLQDARPLDLPALEPRGAAVADVRIDGHDLRVIGMHLGLTAGPRLRQAAAIVAEAEAHPPRPSILMGDMNEWRNFAGALALFGERHHLSPPRSPSTPRVPWPRSTASWRAMSCASSPAAPMTAPPPGAPRITSPSGPSSTSRTPHDRRLPRRPTGEDPAPPRLRPPPSPGRPRLQGRRMIAFLDFIWETLIALCYLAGVIVALRAAGRAHTAQGAAAWAMALVLAPFAALPLYLLFGPPNNRLLASGQRRARAAALARIGPDRLPRPAAPEGEDAALREPLERLASLPTVLAPRPELLIDGDATFDAVFRLIERAEHHIALQFYIYRDDALGRRLTAALKAKARAGVRVTFLYDAVGARSYGRWDELEAAGVECRPFAIGRRVPRVMQLNFRNHRKMVVADGRAGILSGQNVGIEYLGQDPAFGPWRDTAILLRGPAAAALDASFAEDWAWAGGRPLADAPQPGALEPRAPERRAPEPEALEPAARGCGAFQRSAAEPPALAPRAPERGAPEAPAPGADIAGPELCPVLVLPTGPSDPRPSCTLALIHLIASARHRIWIATPYFVPELDLLTALKLAALRGVDVRILMPDEVDHRIVWLAAFAYVDEALEAGITLHRYTEGFMHQKVILLDDRAASVGTVNLDARSLRLNFELTALVFDPVFAAQVETMLKADFARAVLHDEARQEARPFWVKVLAPAARLAAPIL